MMSGKNSTANKSEIKVGGNPMSRLTEERKILASKPGSSKPGSLLITMMTLFALVMSLTSCSSRETKGAEKSTESTAEKSAEPANGNVTQKTFASPEAASTALFDAAKAGDQNALMGIFGQDGKEILFSGDAVKDKNLEQRFVVKYTEMNRWSKNKAGDEILYVGADNYPFPIPLKQNTGGQWVFNTAAGKDEVLARRIGDGELTAIGVLTEIVGAQEEYFNQNHQYAQKFVSDEGQHDGLYWPVSEGQHPSPLGSLGDVAKALGYSRSDKPQPFNGYYFHILTKQGDKAEGGASDYLTNGKLTGGFAVVAYPATYKDSGIMTFLVGKDGVVYQKDLGDKTAETAAGMSEYNPEGWAVVLAPENNGPVGTKTANK
jgi:Protein of unknown function (DUF2950)